MLVHAAHQAAYKVGTRAAYRSARRLFDYFCQLLHIDPEGAVTEFELCAMCWMFCHSRSVNSLGGWLTGVAKHRASAGLSDLPRNEFFKQHKRGLFAIFGPVDIKVPATPLTEADLRKLRASLDLYPGPCTVLVRDACRVPRTTQGFRNLCWTTTL